MSGVISVDFNIELRDKLAIIKELNRKERNCNDEVENRNY